MAGHTAPAPALVVDYAWADAGPVRKVHVKRVSGPADHVSYDESWQYVDGLGRSLFTVSQAESGWIVGGLHVPTANGLVARAFEPFAFAAADGSTYPTNTLPPAPSLSFQYDAFGRRVASTGFDGKTTSKIVYHPLDLSTEVRDGEQIAGGAHGGAFTRIFADGHDRAVRSVQHFGAPADEVTTTTTYLATGEISAIQKSHTAAGDQSLRWMSYDSLGRLVLNAEPNTSGVMSLVPGVVTPDMKAWRYVYNDSGELVGTSDARGCGENLVHDRLGRILAEDYSPCEAQQGAYSPPNLATGEGLEAFYQYDVPEAPEAQGQDPARYLGHLIATYDRAEHTQLVLDARGRGTNVFRQIAKPGVGSAPFVGRYAPHRFERSVRAYDEQNRATSVHTGADVAELAPSGAGSFVTTTFTPRGTVSSVTSSYGPVLASQAVDANGQIRQQVFADAAKTTADFAYQVNGLVSDISIHRGKGPWIPASATYHPPSAGDPNTLQGELTHLSLVYDAVGNPTGTVDSSDPAQWPAGAKPVASQSMQYDDTYRLREVEHAYGGAVDDAFVPPFDGDDAYPKASATPRRVRKQTFEYDWLGNTASSDDDAHVFGDRSYGSVIPGMLGTSVGPNQIKVTSAKDGSNIHAAYDAAGNTTALTVAHGHACTGCVDERYEYDWDEVGRLARARRFDGASSGSAEAAIHLAYQYAADGHRVVRQRHGHDVHDTEYSVDVFDSLRLDGAKFPDAHGDYERIAATESAYLTSNGARLAHVVVMGDDVPSATSGRLHVLLELGNTVGSTSFVIDRDTGEVVERATYQAYGGGDSDYRTSRWGRFREAYRYGGQEDDSEVGLAYAGHRYYAPTLGRWLSPDPLQIHAFGSDSNPYAYVLGSPYRFIDPDGLQTSGCDNLSPGCQGVGIDVGGFLSKIGDFLGHGGGGSGSGGGPHGWGVYTPPRPPPPPRPLEIGVATGTAQCQALTCHTSYPSSPRAFAGPSAHDFYGFVDSMATAVISVGGPENIANAVGTGERAFPAVTDRQALVSLTAMFSLGAIAKFGAGQAVGSLLLDGAAGGLLTEVGAQEIGILRDAAKGSGNFGLGAADSTTATRLGEAWVGDGAMVASDGKTLISSDGLRQFRSPSFKPFRGIFQANFEQRLRPQGPWNSNGHLDILFGPLEAP